jgi:UDP-2,3-diacylglucosamine pyrophosphatase LpxH
MKSSTQKYYFVSDLHMGGDGALQHCDYSAEFIEFLKGLEKEGPDTELLIVGDTFGFWELTLVHGVEKLDHIVAAHQAIFDQLRATGERIKITMMVSVGTTQIPDWILSNYFYREMSAVLRWVLLPFLLLAGVTIVAIAGEILRVTGVFDYNILFHNPLMTRLGIIDNVLQVVIAINSIFLVLFGIPALLVQRDLLRTLRRFRLLTGHGMIPNVDSEESYLKAAQKVFQSDPTVAVFIFGHTHAAFFKSLGPSGQAVLNMGTWLKLLHRVPVRFGLLPAVYYPSYRLNYFCIEKQNNRLVITYVAIPKTPERELTWLQRLMTLGKAPKPPESIPAKTVIDL